MWSPWEKVDAVLNQPLFTSIPLENCPFSEMPKTLTTTVTTFVHKREVSSCEILVNAQARSVALHRPRTPADWPRSRRGRGVATRARANMTWKLGERPRILFRGPPFCEGTIAKTRQVAADESLRGRRCGVETAAPRRAGGPKRTTSAGHRTAPRKGDAPLRITGVGRFRDDGYPSPEDERRFRTVDGSIPGDGHPCRREDPPVTEHHHG
jgi:hypothetical protein